MTSARPAASQVRRLPDFEEEDKQARAQAKAPKQAAQAAAEAEATDAQESDDDSRAPPAGTRMARTLTLIKLDPQQKFTQPPPRFNEATW